MKNKLFISILTIFLSNSINSQNFIETILSYKELNLNQIEEALILNDFEFVYKTVVDEYGGGSYMDKLDKNWYETRFYEHVNYLGEKTEIIVRVYEKEKDHNIIIWTDSRNIQKRILSDMINANFKVTNENKNYLDSGKYELRPFSRMGIGKHGVIENSSRVYRKQNIKIVAVTLKAAVITWLNKEDYSFRYNSNKVFTEYEFIIK